MNLTDVNVAVRLMLIVYERLSLIHSHEALAHCQLGDLTRLSEVRLTERIVILCLVVCIRRRPRGLSYLLLLLLLLAPGVVSSQVL